MVPKQNGSGKVWLTPEGDISQSHCALRGPLASDRPGWSCKSEGVAQKYAKAITKDAIDGKDHMAHVCESIRDLLI